MEHGSLRFYCLSTAEVRENPSPIQSVLIAVGSNYMETSHFPMFHIRSLRKTSVPSLVLLLEILFFYSSERAWILTGS